VKDTWPRIIGAPVQPVAPHLLGGCVGPRSCLDAAHKTIISYATGNVSCLDAAQKTIISYATGNVTPTPRSCLAYRYSGGGVQFILEKSQSRISNSVNLFDVHVHCVMRKRVAWHAISLLPLTPAVFSKARCNASSMLLQGTLNSERETGYPDSAVFEY
jgi:hypothetical protein